MVGANVEEVKQNKSCVKVEVQNIMNLKVEKEGDTTILKIKRNIPMVKIMNAYCNSKGVSLNNFKVLVDGNAITNLDLTPAELDLTEEDVVEVFLHTDGG